MQQQEQEPLCTTLGKDGKEFGKKIKVIPGRRGKIRGRMKQQMEVVQQQDVQSFQFSWPTLGKEFGANTWTS